MSTLQKCERNKCVDGDSVYGFDGGDDILNDDMSIDDLNCQPVARSDYCLKCRLNYLKDFGL